MSIPKKIHYCWFGHGEKPDCFEQCFESWKKYAPDYEIVELNESNIDLKDYPFAQQAYEAKKYAFVSDIARLKVIHDVGGVYLDTDVELKGSLDALLSYQSFFFFNINGDVNTGFGFGAEKGNPVVARMLEDYNRLEFSVEKTAQLACPIVNTDSLIALMPMLERIDKTAIIDGNAFLSSCEYKKYAFHFAKYSWGSEAIRKAEKYKKYNRNIKRWWWIRRILRNQKIFDFLSSKKMDRIYKIYGTLVYDVLDNGLLYYGYRFWQKLKGEK